MAALATFCKDGSCSQLFYSLCPLFSFALGLIIGGITEVRLKGCDKPSDVDYCYVCHSNSDSPVCKDDSILVSGGCMERGCYCKSGDDFFCVDQDFTAGIILLFFGSIVMLAFIFFLIMLIYLKCTSTDHTYSKAQTTEDDEKETNIEISSRSVAKTDTIQLPVGWRTTYTNDGTVYYINDITKSTQWEKPTMAVNNENNKKLPLMHTDDEKKHENEDNLPEGWRKSQTKDGKVYYQNSITKHTQWEKPNVIKENENNEQLPLINTDTEKTKNKREDNEDDLPNGWIKLYTNDGKAYYQNKVAKKTQWQRPTKN